MTAIFIKLLNMSISASWIVLAVLILRLLLKKAPKWITMVLWGLVALRLVLPFSIESAFSLIPSTEAVDPGIIENYTPETEVDTPVYNETNAPVVNETGSPVVNETAKPTPNVTVPPVNVETVPPVVTVPSVPSVTVPPVVVVPPVSNVTLPPALDETNSPVLDETASPVVKEPDAPVISDIQEPKPAKNTVQTVMNVISIVWVVGIAAMAIYTAVSYYLLRKKIDTAVRFRDNIHKSENVDSPFVVGMIKPKIYLPFNIKEQDAEYVIAHENAHIKRLDYIWKPLGFILLTVYWFNPVMWLGYILLCRDIELACDEKVIAGFDSEQRADYSEALLSCSVNRKAIAACPIAFGEVGVKDRIKSVLNYKKPALWIIILAVVAIIATALCFLTDPVSKEESLGNEETGSEDTDNSAGTDIAISDSFLSVLKSEKTFFDESGNSVYLKDYRLGTNIGVQGPYAVPCEYAIVDFNSDGTNEMFVYVSKAFGTSMVFREDGDNVYGYEFGEKEIENLKEDGSFSRIRRNGETVSFFEGLSFDGTSYQITEKAYINETTQKFRLNGESSPQESVKVYQRDFNRKSSVKWMIYDADSNESRETDKQMDTALTLSFLNILNNKMTCIDESGSYLSLKDYMSEAKNSTGVYKYAIVDFDSDGTDEMVVDVLPGFGKYVMFHFYNYEIYGFEFSHTEMIDLFVDGSFRRLYSGSMESKYFNLKFEGTSYQLEEILNFSHTVSSVNWKEKQLETGSQLLPDKQPEPLEPLDYVGYYDFLLDLCSNNPENIWGFFVKDLDNNGVEELIVDHDNSMEYSFYTIDNGVVKLIEKYDFLTGTTRLLETNDEAYPGLICFTVGGGAEHYVYLTIKDGQLSFEKIWDDNYSGTYDTPTTEYTTDKKLIEVSANAYNNNQDIDLMDLSHFAILNSRKAFIDETGRYVYLKDHKFVFDGSSMPIIEYTTVDMDNDGEKELIVNVGPEGNQMFVMVFRIYNGNVYGYQFGIRSLHSIKTDGSYWASSSAFEGSILKLEFEGTSYKEVEIAYHNTTDNVYRINGVNATKEESDKFESEWNKIPYVDWIEWRSVEKNQNLPTADQLIGVEEPFLSVLTGKLAFIEPDYTFGGEKKVYISEYCKINPLGRYTIVDFNKDGQNEIVVGIDNALYLLLHKNGDSVVGHIYSHRTFGNLYTNGTYSWHQQTGDVLAYGLGTFEFSGNKATETTLCRVEQNDTAGTVVYYVGEKQVSKEEYDAFYSQNGQQKSVWINWQDIDSQNYRDIGEMQTETQSIITIDGKSYQSYVASNADVRYIFISADEYPTSVEWRWDWVAIGTANEYSLELIGKVDEGRIAVDLLLVNYFKTKYEEYKDQPYVIVDLDSDGTDEMVVNASVGSGLVMVFRFYNGKVYSYEFKMSELKNLKKDCSFMQGSSNYLNSVSRLEFEGTSCKFVEIAYRDLHNNVYRLNGAAVSKEELEKFDEEWNKIPGVNWVVYSTLDETLDYETAYKNYMDTRFVVDTNFPDSYAFYDLNKDGTPELLYWSGYHLYVYFFEDGVVKEANYAQSSRFHGPTDVLENGAILYRHSSTGNEYCYQILNADHTVTKLFFNEFYRSENEIIYEFDGNKVSKAEWESLTKPYFDIPKVQIVWKAYEHEFYVDLNFDSKLDKLVPHERSAYAVFYKAYVWNEAKGDYIYAPSFELFPNVSIDTERKVLLAHFSGGMTTSYSMFTYNGEDFESTHSLYWSFVENGKTQLKEQEYVVETGSSERKTLERKNINIDKDYLQLYKTDEQLKGYFEAGSLWDLDGAKWKNYVCNMDNSDWWKLL